VDVRAQIAMVFHLDKCIGCHTCSISCKNVWTDRKGAEYMWWNNVETKPGVGYPFLWEDQQRYRGGWEKKGRKLMPKLQGRLKALLNIFFNPFLPKIDDYYEPWTYRYEDLFSSEEGEDQPTARPISMITGKPIEIESGPAWDDDLSGSTVYAKKDPDLRGLSEEERKAIFSLERIFFFYLPRICNHCLNPTYVAVCPATAIYKRGEDGIVLVNQTRCRGWRMCISGCPYKKVYYNWETGKSEKCILCYPRLETGQAPMCFHSCVGRIRYLGVLLYDAEKIEEAAKAGDRGLVEAQRELILDPHDPKIVDAAKKSGISDKLIRFAQESPVYIFVKKNKIALPLHPEYRTLPMLFYIPPLLPVVASFGDDGALDLEKSFFTDPERFRAPLKYIAEIFSGGNTELVLNIYRKLVAVRVWRRWRTTGDFEDEAKRMLNECGLCEEDAEEIYRLTSLADNSERFRMPPPKREELLENPEEEKKEGGFGFTKRPKRTF
jgi:nitrate reductase beta subunit